MTAEIPCSAAGRGGCLHLVTVRYVGGDDLEICCYAMGRYSSLCMRQLHVSRQPHAAPRDPDRANRVGGGLLSE